MIIICILNIGTVQKKYSAEVKCVMQRIEDVSVPFPVYEYMYAYNATNTYVTHTACIGYRKYTFFVARVQTADEKVFCVEKYSLLLSR